MKREMRSVLCHALVVDLTFDQSENVAIAVVSSSTQLLLTCIEGCGLRSNTNRVKVHAAACTLY